MCVFPLSHGSGAVHIELDLPSLLSNGSSKFLREEIQDFNKPKDRRSLSVRSWARVRSQVLLSMLYLNVEQQTSKALLVRKHPLAMQFSQKLFEFFGDEQVGWDAARSIGELIVPESILSKANHADVKVVLCAVLPWIILTPELLDPLLSKICY